ncbi:hypothetical protein EDC48_110117 [Gibbsiella quercinecans]|nr:hypothetical protein EDC48_110117 [Gibbsiella quercinecans]
MPNCHNEPPVFKSSMMVEPQIIAFNLKIKI